MSSGDPYIIDDGTIELNPDRESVEVEVTNTGDRPVQVGSHYHFYETNRALEFDRSKAKGHRLDIPAGTCVRFEPGLEMTVQLVPYGGKQEAIGFRKEDTKYGNG